MHMQHNIKYKHIYTIRELAPARGGLLHPVHRPETADEVGVVDVDVGELYADQVRDLR